MNDEEYNWFDYRNRHPRELLCGSTPEFGVCSGDSVGCSKEKFTQKEVDIRF